MSFDKIAAGAYGYELELTFKDVDTEAAEDLSGYSSSQSIEIKAPDGSVNTVSGGWSSDGTDGKVKITVASGTLPAKWKGRTVAARIKVASGGAVIYSEWEEFKPV
jgi:hypothetical protein